jgi:tRNA (guanine-N7-)-methyltransferase
MKSSYQAHFAAMPTMRHIRSFVLRAGRVTIAQERALQELWPAYGVTVHDGPLDLDGLFGRRARRCVEIGFGTGEVIGALAAAHPEGDFLGIEVHRSGVGRLLLQAQAAGISNLRVVCHDAVEVLSDHLADACIDEILIFFPDPWHKKRHHKRRLIDAAFVAELARVLRPGGILRLATDWQPYAAQMLEVCNDSGALKSLSADGGFVERPAFRPPTRFERRGQRLGHGVWDLAYRRREAGPI